MPLVPSQQPSTCEGCEGDDKLVRLGFVILSHGNPHQLLRLCSRLDTMFGGCSIVCHHDFERSSVDASKFPSNVAFVTPSLRTFWGHISLVHAELAALRLLYDRSNPDWFYLLSGADYPVREPSVILEHLAGSEVDGYVNSQLVEKCKNELDTPVRPEHFATWNDAARYRYLETMLSPSGLAEIESAPDVIEASRLLEERAESLLMRAERSLPRNLRCYAGDHWITGNRAVARVLLSVDSVMSELLEFFHYSAISDEAIYQTVLRNDSDLRLADQNMRFADWTTPGGHPRILDTSDLPSIWASGAHFARKFAPETPVLDAIDIALGTSPQLRLKTIGVS